MYNTPRYTHTSSNLLDKLSVSCSPVFGKERVHMTMFI